MVDEKENKTERVQMLMAPSEVEAIDDWGFKNRIRTRAEAIRRLCQIGIAFETKLDAIYKKVEEGTELWDEAITNANLKEHSTAILHFAKSAIELRLMITELTLTAHTLRNEDTEKERASLQALDEALQSNETDPK